MAAKDTGEDFAYDIDTDPAKTVVPGVAKVAAPDATPDAANGVAPDPASDTATDVASGVASDTAPDVRATPQKLYLLGHPVAHSASPAMHNAVYERLGLPWRYDLCDCESAASAASVLEAHDYLALNITTPYKPSALACADTAAASARLAAGANLLVRKDGVRLAYNVDGTGCVDYLEYAGVSLEGKTAAVCGTGPCALAIVAALAQAKVACVVLLGRDLKRTHAVLESYVRRYRELVRTDIGLPSPSPHRLSFREAYRQVRLQYGSYETSKQAIAGADIVIDATPLGMDAADPAPFDTNLLNASQCVLDVVYGHGESALVAAAREAGCSAFDGAGMLVAQARAGFCIVADIFGISVALSPGELFDLMARAAGFDL